MPGVLAAGDVRHGSVKRVASAVGEGSIAVQIVHSLLADEPLHLAQQTGDQRLSRQAAGTLVPDRREPRARRLLISALGHEVERLHEPQAFVEAPTKQTAAQWHEEREPLVHRCRHASK